MKNVLVAYAGGQKKGANGSGPTYHAMLDYTEAIRVEFNPATHSLESILRVFLKGIDPFNRCSSSRQYRYAIWHRADAQKAAIDKVVETFCQAKGKSRAHFKVDIEQLGEVWRAEEYHQHYSAKSRGKFTYGDSSDGE